VTVVPKVAYLVDRKETQQVVGMAFDWVDRLAAEMDDLKAVLKVVEMVA
jgi:hypothetical protein